MCWRECLALAGRRHRSRRFCRGRRGLGLRLAALARRRLGRAVCLGRTRLGAAVAAPTLIPADLAVDLLDAGLNAGSLGSIGCHGGQLIRLLRLFSRQNFDLLRDRLPRGFRLGRNRGRLCLAHFLPSFCSVLCFSY